MAKWPAMLVSQLFASSGPQTRGTLLSFNLDDNHALDARGFMPFGVVVAGTPMLSHIYSGYRERPQAARIREHGGAYLHQFPRLSVVLEARVVPLVPEPLLLSKNATGLLVSLGMLLLALVCCGIARLAQRRLGILQQVQGYKKTAGQEVREAERMEGEEDDAAAEVANAAAPYADYYPEEGAEAEDAPLPTMEPTYGERR